MLRLKSKSSSLKPGFTIVELLIIAPIVILTIGAFITVIVSMTGEVLASRSSNSLAYNIQNTLNRIESDAKSSTTFLEANDVTLTSGQGYDDATQNFANVGANGNMLILKTFATTGNPASAASGLVYLTGQPNDCTSPQQNTPMMMNVIYFVKNSQLWRRSIMTSDYATAGCTVPWQQPSCSAAAIAAPKVFCKTQDELMIDGINPGDFVVQYYSTSGTTTADIVATDTGALPATRHDALNLDSTVGVSISVTKTTAGRDISQSGTIRATGDGGALPVLPPTGGTISYSGGYTIHTFTTSGTFTINGGSASIQYLVIGGGGGGGGSNGGGGGAGGYLEGTQDLSGGMSVTVGASGSGGAYPNNGQAGGNSQFGDIAIALGGGGGRTESQTLPAAGGSGGGGTGYPGANIGGASGTSGQGHSGGTGYFGSGIYLGAGGGGAGAVGGDAYSANHCGDGGVGLSSSISGSATYYAGGGGGGGYPTTTTPGSGGSGVGGAGSVTSVGSSGTVNTGGGGGGAQNGYGSGGAGGSGIVIIRYLTP